MKENKQKRGTVHCYFGILESTGNPRSNSGMKRKIEKIKLSGDANTRSNMLRLGMHASSRSQARSIGFD